MKKIENEENEKGSSEELMESYAITQRVITDYWGVNGVNMDAKLGLTRKMFNLIWGNKYKDVKSENILYLALLNAKMLEEVIIVMWAWHIYIDKPKNGRDAVYKKIIMECWSINDDIKRIEKANEMLFLAEFSLMKVNKPRDNTLRTCPLCRERLSVQLFTERGICKQCWTHLLENSKK